MKILKSTILKVSIFAFSFAALLTVASCNKNEDSKEVAEVHNEAKFENSKEEEEDAEFLVAAAEINLEEIKLGQLAQKNSKMQSVIDLGRMMEVEHSMALKDLEIFASQKQITIPTTITEEGQNSYDQLKDKFGVDFDNEYCEMMVKGHEKAISKFEKESSKSNDTDIKSWAEKMLVSLRSHLDKSISCQEKCAKMKSNS